MKVIVTFTTSRQMCQAENEYKNHLVFSDFLCAAKTGSVDTCAALQRAQRELYRGLKEQATFVLDTVLRGRPGIPLRQNAAVFKFWRAGVVPNGQKRWLAEPLASGCCDTVGRFFALARQ
jgi:hypothetical protein